MLAQSSPTIPDWSVVPSLYAPVSLWLGYAGRAPKREVHTIMNGKTRDTISFLGGYCTPCHWRKLEEDANDEMVQRTLRMA
jgi:hypothetical protein